MPKERPILFNAAMVRAILNGHKTQTRRVMKAQPEPTPDDYTGQSGHWFPCRLVQSMVHVERDLKNQNWEMAGTCCPYGDIGDRLWVREAHALLPRTAYRASVGTGTIEQVEHPTDGYTAAVFREGFDRSGAPKWRPSIHMPRWASRITLEIVSVRVERLQDISNEDAVAEGIGTPLDIRYAALDEFKPLWESINGAGSWAANPWVWVVEFKRLEASQ
jgi:hypothetical protein